MKSHSGANGVWRKLGRRNTIVATHFHQIQTVRKSQHRIYFKGRYGFLVRTWKTNRARVFWIHFIEDGKRGAMSVAHARLLHDFIKNRARYDIGFQVCETRSKENIRLTSFESHPDIVESMLWRRLGWRIGSKGKQRSIFPKKRKAFGKGKKVVEKLERMMRDF